MTFDSARALTLLRTGSGHAEANFRDGSLALATDAGPREPVLLIDDLVDSRWTLTVAAWLLRKAEASTVWPLALAQAGAGS